MMRTVIAGLFTTVVFLAFPLPSLAATFRLEPPSSTIPVGQTLDVNVVVESEGSRVLSADVKLGYDPNVLEVVAIRNGTIFEKYLHTIVEPYIFLSGGNRMTSAAGNGLLGTVVLRGKAFGVASLRFDCRQRRELQDGAFADFINIENENEEDIVNCTTLSNGIYTVTIPPNVSRDDGSVYGLNYTNYTVSPTPVTYFGGLLARPLVSPKPTIPTQPPTGSVQGASAVAKPQGIPSLIYAVVSLTLFLFGILAVVVAIII